MKKNLPGKVIVLDSGTLISLSMNGLTDELRKLKKIFSGSFLITIPVKSEVIDKPLKIKQFELEAFRIKKLLDEGIIELADSFGIDDSAVEKKAEEIMNMANSLFRSSQGWVNLMQLGEASCLALSKILDEKKIKNIIAIDERTTRMLAEKPENLHDLLVKKLHTNIKLVKANFGYFKGFRVIRSTELIYVAWKKNLVELKDGPQILDALLYALKFKGCSISLEEIEEIKKMK